MGEIKYPTPDRSYHSKSFQRNEYGEIDIGHNSGVTSDGRPYLAEMWARDSISVVTIFISAMDIEDYSEEDLLKYLELEGLIRFLSDNRNIGASKFVDSSGNQLWSLNIAIGVDDETYADTGFGIKSYKNK